jgi:hypothetical protein
MMFSRTYLAHLAAHVLARLESDYLEIHRIVSDHDSVVGVDPLVVHRLRSFPAR